MKALKALKAIFEVSHTCERCGSEYVRNSDWDVSLINKPNITSPLLPYYQEIRELYLSGKTMRFIANHYHCQYRSVRYALIKQGVILRPRGRAKGFSPKIQIKLTN